MSFGVTAEISGQSSIELVTTTETEFGDGAMHGGTSLWVSDLGSLIDVQQESLPAQGVGCGAVVPALTGSILQSPPTRAGSGVVSLPHSSTILDDVGRVGPTSSPVVVGVLRDAGRDALTRSRRQSADTILDAPEGVQPSAPLNRSGVFSATVTRVGVRRGDQLIDDFGAVEILMARGR
ncbi:hypothetical protein KFU94_00640 [Chloroflexi bacterium TSY]|nr:hypothetical protein [Chloroflexi bacterium TSY]